MVLRNCGWYLSAGIACVLAWAACSREPDLTDEQRRGLEAMARWANPSEQDKRFVELRNKFADRAIGGDNADLCRAWEPLQAEFDRRRAGGELTKELVDWYEAETSRTDDEIVARWKPAASK